MFASSKVRYFTSGAAFCVSLALGGMIASPALADPVTHFSSSNSAVYGKATNGTLDTLDSNADFKANGLANGGPASSAAAANSAWGTASNAASTDLSTGKLSLRNSLESFENGNLRSEVFASMGDSFRASSGSGGYSPFAWSGTDTASFSFDISGLYDAQNTADTMYFSLSILKAGALDEYAGYAQGGSLPNTWFDENELQSFSYALGAMDPAQAPYFTDFLTEFPSTLTASFTPGGDFDWAINFYALSDYSLSEADPSQEAYSVFDFSHTIVASYQGPQGSTTYSASGAFPGTQSLGPISAVPEPATWAIMITGFGLAGVALRRRKALPFAA